jgi:hypothetical protein
MLTYEELQELVPKRQRTVISEEIVDKINLIAAEPEAGEEFKQNLFSYSTVIANGSYSLKEYTNGVWFVTLILLGHKDIDAYRIVFKDRYRKLIDKGLDRSKISAYATAVKKTKIVSQLLEQTMVPSYILNAPIYQEALNHSRYLMLNARSETVQQKAAETIMTQLKAPEAAKLEVDISVNKGDIIEDNEAFMRKIAEAKLVEMEKGGDVHKLTNMTMNAEIVEEEV